MAIIWMDVDAALSEVPVNAFPLTDDTDFKSTEESVAYNATGMDLEWHFVTTAGAYTVTAVTPTTAGVYDWAHQGNGMYSIEIPASGGASINNDTEGFGYFVGLATGVLPWRGPTIGLRAAALNNAMIDGGDNLDVNLVQWLGTAPNALQSQRVDSYIGAKASGVSLSDQEKADVNAEADTALSDYDPPTRTEATSDKDEVLAVLPAALVGGRIDANVGAISADATAADNLEAQYDGTGITGDNYPATQAQVSAISVASAAINAIADSYTLTTGTQSSGTFASTQALDGTNHEHTDDTGAMELYYEFDVGTDGIPVSTKFTGYLNGNNDSVDVFAYNWAGTSWDQVGTLAGKAASTNETHTYDLYTSHVGTGSNVGLVRIRFYAAAGLTTATLAVDQLLCSYAQGVTGIANGSTVTLGAATTNTNLIGHNWILALGGQDITGSYVFQATSVTGTGTGTNGTNYTFQECNFGAATLDAFGFVHQCAFADTLTLASTGGVSADSFNAFSCYSGVAGSGAPTIDASGVTKTTNIQIRDWFGGLTATFTADCVVSIEAVLGGTHSITTGGGDIEWRGSPKALTIVTSGAGTTNAVVANGAPVNISGTGGTVNVYGVFGKVTDTSTGTTVDEFPVCLDPDAATAQRASSLGILKGTVDNTAFTATTTILEADDITEATADHFIGRHIIWTSGNLLQQETDITDYALNGGRGRFTYTAVTDAPADNSTFVIV